MGGGGVQETQSEWSEQKAGYKLFVKGVIAALQKKKKKRNKKCHFNSAGEGTPQLPAEDVSQDGCILEAKGQWGEAGNAQGNPPPTPVAGCD